MAAEGKAIIFYWCNFSKHFVRIDKRPATGSQPNLASRSEVASIYKCSQKCFRDPPQNSGAITSNFGPLFRDFHTRHRISPEWNVASTNQNAIVNLQCFPIKDDLLSVTFDPETVEICLLIVTHPMKIQLFPSLPGFKHKGHSTKFCQMLANIRGLLCTVKIL